MVIVLVRLLPFVTVSLFGEAERVKLEPGQLFARLAAIGVIPSAPLRLKLYSACSVLAAKRGTVRVRDPKSMAKAVTNKASPLCKMRHLQRFLVLA